MSDQNEMPLGEVVRSKHAELLNALVEMQQAPLYAVRKYVLAQAEGVIASQEKELASILAELERLKGELNAERLMVETLEARDRVHAAENEALRKDAARMDFIEKNGLFIALDGRKFSHCQMGAGRGAIDATIAAMQGERK